MDQIKVKLLDNKHDDLFVVNAARVSFNRWKELFDSNDDGLLCFLAREQHSSPFRHARLAFMFPTTYLGSLPDMNLLNPFQRAGFVVHDTEDGKSVIYKNSIFGWASIVQQNIGSEEFRNFISYQLHKHCSSCAVALNIPEVDAITHYGAWIPEKDLVAYDNPWLLDLSFRCTVPIWLSRQLVKHQVSLSWNEVSRRYVSTYPDLFDQELRCKPDGGIKQGSGNTCTLDQVPWVNIEDGVDIPMEYVTQGLLKWYAEAIANDIAPETVRGYMPLNMMTEYIWSGALPAFAHMVNLRSEGHAQKEAQFFAKKISDQIHLIYPKLWTNMLK